MKRYVWLVAVMVLTLATAVSAATLRSSGKVTFLRVNDINEGFGPSDDKILVEVVIKLDSRPGQAFGFKLRDDSSQIARRGMLDLLRDGFNHNWIVTIDYNIEANKDNGEIIRVELTKPVGVVVGGTGGGTGPLAPN